MSTSNSSFSIAWIQQGALPVVTTLLGAAGLLGGAYTLASPVEGAKMFGLVPSSSTDKGVQAWQRAYVKVHGIRNVANGVVLMGLAGYWRLSSPCQSSPLAAVAVKRNLGVVLLAGTIVPIADGYIVSEFTKAIETENKNGGSDEALEVGRKQSNGHLFTTLPIIAVALGWLLS